LNEPAGFRDFVDTRSRSLLRTAWLLTGDWHTAQDLVQAALAKTWPRWNSLTRRDEPEVYVRRVMVNTYATWWRRRWRSEISSGELPDDADDHDVYAAVDLRNAVQSALATLPRRQRAVIVLRFYDDLTEAQAARVLNCSVGTVKSQASRALAKLRVSPVLGALTTEEVAP
jgi:RNA polymerase sigma-70 factor (sigma-E family)